LPNGLPPFANFYRTAALAASAGQKLSLSRLDPDRERRSLPAAAAF
jgi:hypothetical protein